MSDAETPTVPNQGPKEYARRFVLDRDRDMTGHSGKGIVAHGIQFPDGTVAYRWTSNPRTTQIADSIQDVQHIHGHAGKTSVVWRDT